MRAASATSTLFVLCVAVVTGHDRDAGGGHPAARAGLVAHRLDRGRRRPDEDQPGGVHRGGEGRVLREKAVARMNRLRARGACRSDDPAGVEIRLGRSVPPIATNSSHAATCGLSRSASEQTAIVAIPMRRAVRAIRTAISPRLAISSRLSCVSQEFGSSGAPPPAARSACRAVAAIPSLGAPCRSKAANSSAAASSAAGSGVSSARR